jgi:hypothetical protein
VETLNKLETAAVLSAVQAIIKSAPALTISNHHPLRTAAKKLERNLEEYNATR